MVKKLTALALCASMAASLAACGGSAASSSAAPAPAASTAASAAASTASAAVSGDPALVALASEGMQTSIDCEPIELSLGCSGTVDGTVLGDAMHSGIEAAAAWTNGSFKVNFYQGGQLGGDAELISGMQMGSVDMYTGAPTSQTTVIPELAVLDIGGLYKDTAQATAVLADFQDQLNSYYQKANLELLAIYSPAFRILTSNKPVQTAEDLKGLNIRTQENEYHMAFWKELGTNPTPLAFGELYIALQQGMMDAQENPWASIVGAKLNEVQKYMVETNHIPFVTTFVISKAKFDSLSDNQKLALTQLIEYIKRYQLAGAAADDERLKQICIDGGSEVSPVSEDVLALYPAATQAVVDLMKTKIDPALVDAYVQAAQAAQ